MSALRKPAACPPCNHCCNSGRACPARAACQLPEEPAPIRFHLGLRSLVLHARRFYLRSAQRQMGPLHPDFPETVHELAAIERELANP